MEPAGDRMKRRGFSLVEAAIVLAVVGLVVAGIWVAASAVMESRRISLAANQTILLVDNTRRLMGDTLSAYVTQVGAGWHEITAEMIDAGVAQADMVSNGSLFTPWGTPFSIWAGSGVTVGSGEPEIGITFWGIPTSACRKFVAAISSRFHDRTILTDIHVQGVGVGFVEYESFPVSPDDSSLCQSTASTMDYLNFFFLP